MKYYIIAGEASGDLHGSNLIKAIQSLDKDAAFRGYGGDKMKSEGMHLIKHFRKMAFMGFVEVIKNLPAILKNLRQCKADILGFQPDVLVLIDYPGFNMRIAKWAKSKGIKVVYYIVPQVWAWHQSRVHDLAKNTDKLLVILPFEKAFFARFGYEASFVGHPLLDAITAFKSENRPVIRSDKAILAMLPGSRKQEVENMLPVFLDSVRGLEYDVFVACAPGLDFSLYQKIVADKTMTGSVHFLKDGTYSLLNVASLALVSSGTATLETALFGVPQVVCYKGNNISFAIARRLVKLKYISLVNLICDKAVVRELIQYDMNAHKIREAINEIQENGEEYYAANYGQLRQLIGGEGASMRAAKEITEMCRPT